MRCMLRKASVPLAREVFGGDFCCFSAFYGRLFSSSVGEPF